MKFVALTEEELKTLIWCVQGKTASEAKRLLSEGKAPSNDETIQRLNEISKKAYVALVC